MSCRGHASGQSISARGGSVKDEEIIEILKKEDAEFLRLYQEHKALDSQLQELGRKPYLTPEEEMEEKKAKKAKLQRKDKIAEYVRNYRKKMSSA